MSQSALVAKCAWKYVRTGFSKSSPDGLKFKIGMAAWNVALVPVIARRLQFRSVPELDVPPLL